MTKTAAQRRTQVIEDTEWLLSWGVWPDEIAKRLGYRNAEGLSKSLNNFGRKDLVRRLRLQDHTGRAYQLAHNTILDEVHAKTKRKWCSTQKLRGEI